MGRCPGGLQRADEGHLQTSSGQAGSARVVRSMSWGRCDRAAELRSPEELQLQAREGKHARGTGAELARTRGSEVGDRVPESMKISFWNGTGEAGRGVSNNKDAVVGAFLLRSKRGFDLVVAEATRMSAGS